MNLEGLPVSNRAATSRTMGFWKDQNTHHAANKTEPTNAWTTSISSAQGYHQQVERLGQPYAALESHVSAGERTHFHC